MILAWASPFNYLFAVGDKLPGVKDFHLEPGNNHQIGALIIFGVIIMVKFNQFTELKGQYFSPAIAFAPLSY